MEVDVLEIQRCLLAMIKKFHEFSIENGIQYYIASGTLLGAVRHKGFIPWDDDIDIYILREDYDKLTYQLYKKLPEGLELRCYTTQEGVPTHFAKIIDTNTTLIENKFADYIEGIYIDVFPLDGIKPGCFLDEMRWKYARFLNSILISKHQTTSKHSYVKEFFRRFCKIVDDKKLQMRIEKLLKTRRIKDCDYVGDFLGAYDKKEIFKKELFESPSLYEFEGTDLFGVTSYDSYLSQIYGDYMELPPEEKRTHKHEVLYINYEEPYLNHMKSGGKT